MSLRIIEANLKTKAAILFSSNYLLIQFIHSHHRCDNKISSKKIRVYSWKFVDQKCLPLGGPVPICAIRQLADCGPKKSAFRRTFSNLSAHRRICVIEEILHILFILYKDVATTWLHFHFIPVSTKI